MSRYYHVVEAEQVEIGEAGVLPGACSGWEVAGSM
jgi:hypothetical protein